MPFSALAFAAAVLFALSLPDVEAGLLSALVIISLYLAIRQQITSSWRDRAEAAEMELRDSRGTVNELTTQVHKLEAMPNLEKMYSRLVEHDEKSAAAWVRVSETLAAVQQEVEAQTEVLQEVLKKF